MVEPSAQSPLNVALIKQLKEELKSELKRDLALALEDIDGPKRKKRGGEGCNHEDGTEMMPLGAAAAAGEGEQGKKGEDEALPLPRDPNELDPDPPPPLMDFDEAKTTEMVRSPSTDDLETLPTFDHYVPSANRYVVCDERVR